MNDDSRRKVTLLACCAGTFWIGSFCFALPGVMAPYWQETFGVGPGAVSQLPLWVMLPTGIFTYIAGKYQEIFGHTCIAIIGAIIVGLSTVILGHYQSIGWIYFWAFTMSGGCALIYIPTLIVVQCWYPHRRGVVTGLVNLVFGLSSFPMSHIYNRMLTSMGPVAMTTVIGLLALVTGLIVAPYLRIPQENQIQELAVKTMQQTTPGRSLSASEAVRTKNFWLIWSSWALAGGAGFAMVTLSTMYGKKMGLAMEQAVLILAAFGLMNGLSRIISGYLSDHIGRKTTMSAAFLLGGCGYLLMPHVSGLVMWAFLAGCVACSFGTLFAVTAALASDCFGLKHFGAIFGLIFTAYGFLAGPLGPWLGGRILDLTGGNFTIVFSYLGGFLLIAGTLISFVRAPGEESEDEVYSAGSSLEEVYVPIED